MRDAFRRRFPLAPMPYLDLSTGLNPVAYPMPALPPEAWARLPDADALQALEEDAARAYGVADPTRLVAAPGTQVLISLLPHLLSPREVAVLSPCYGEHQAAWLAAGHAVRPVATLCAPAAVFVLCNPNNPDGRRTDQAALRALADRQLAQGGLLVVDEAFADLEDLVSVAGLVHPALLVLRSFGKTYGLGGVRLGFAIGALAPRLRAALGPWPVSAAAIAAGRAALPDRAWREASVARLDRDGARLDSLLRGAGLALLGGTRLFRLHAGPAASALHDHLGQAGIMVRAFAGFPDRLRFGLPGDAAGWDRLQAALSTFRPAAARLAPCPPPRA